MASFGWKFLAWKAIDCDRDGVLDLLRIHADASQEGLLAECMFVAGVLVQRSWLNAFEQYLGRCFDFLATISDIDSECLDKSTVSSKDLQTLSRPLAIQQIHFGVLPNCKFRN